jgi:hypothetical protein
VLPGCVVARRGFNVTPKATDSDVLWVRSSGAPASTKVPRRIIESSTKEGRTRNPPSRASSPGPGPGCFGRGPLAGKGDHRRLRLHRDHRAVPRLRRVQGRQAIGQAARLSARVAEFADAADAKSTGRDVLWVRPTPGTIMLQQNSRIGRSPLMYPLMYFGMFNLVPCRVGQWS